MDGAIAESWFWLAMNYGQLQQYKEACLYLRKYLEHEPDGDFSWQAEEILDYMRSDLPMLTPDQRSRVDRLCRSGMALVSQGRLREAIKCFTRASDIEPEMSAPKNNLALSWFYLGDIGKAIEMTRDILHREPGNVFANCNLASFYFVLDDHLALRRQVSILDSLWNDDPDEMLKLGTTYGMLSFDRKALDVFRYLYNNGSRSFELLLLLGIATFNCGHLLEAARIFDRINAKEPDNPYSSYRLLCKQGTPGKIPYYLRIPEEALAQLFDVEPGQAELEHIADTPSLWPQLLWIIRNGSSVGRSKVLHALSKMGNRQLIDKVLGYLWDQSIDLACRQEIFTEFAGTEVSVCNQSYWNHGQFSVNRAQALEMALDLLERQGYGFSALNSTYIAWSTFCRKNNPCIRSPRLWCAALLVMAVGLEALDKIAAQFEISPADRKSVV